MNFHINSAKITESIFSRGSTTKGGFPKLDEIKFTRREKPYTFL